jgi:hypothetical protein
LTPNGRLEKRTWALVLALIIPQGAKNTSWTVLKTWQVGGVSDSIGLMDSELNPCEANGGFSTSMIG